MLTSDRLPNVIGSSLVKTLIAGVAFALAALSLAPAAAFADGTIAVKKGGDRIAANSSVSTYATGLSGVRFEYTSDAAKATNPASTGWTLFANLTDVNGNATQTVPAGTYYVRESSVAAGFTNYGPVQSLAFNPSSGNPSTLQPYVAKVVVSNNQTVNARPNRTPSNNTGDWNQTSNGFLQDNTISPFINIRDNQAFPSVCGLNLLLVLDRSGSINDYRTTYRDAAKGLVDSLSDTPTQISITSFSSSGNSYQDGSGNSSYTISPRALSDAGQANEDALKATIDSIYAGPSGSTNWDAALQQASAAKGFSPDPLTGQTANPDVVVFITDGNPTINSTDDGGNGGDVALMNLTAGMASANLVKNQSARSAATPATKLKMYALGVANQAGVGSINANNLKAVSGPTFGEDYETPTVAELSAKLTELAARTCGARIYIRKHLTTNATNQTGWNFAGSSTAGTQSYLDNNRSTHLTSSGVIQTGVLLTKLPTAAGANVTVTEDTSGQPLSNFALTNKVCKTDSYDGTAVTPVGVTSTGLTVTVPRGGALYCTFTNAPAAKLELRKQLSPTNDPGKFNLLADGSSTDVTATDVGHNGTSGAGGSNVAPGSYALSESAGTGTSASDYTMGAPSCVKRSGGAFTVTGGSINLAADDDVICTWTNTRNTGSIELKKAWVGTGGQTTLRIGTSAGGSTVGNQQTGAAGAAPLTTGAKTVNTGTYYVSESGGLADYDSALACTKNGNGFTPGASDSVTVGKNDTIVCTYTNTRKTGTIKLVKNLVNGGADKFNLKLNNVNQVTSPGGSTSFGNGDATAVMTKETGNYTVSEAAVAPALDANYTSTLSCINNQTGAADIDGTVAIAKGDNWVCTYTNTRKQGTVTLNKQWIGTPGVTTLQIGTSNGGGQVSSVQTGAGGGIPQTTGTKTVDTGTYYVSETGGLTDYTSQLSCINNQAGSPDTDGVLTVALDDNWVCTYTNTRKQASVELKKAWVGTGGQTTLNIGTSSNGTNIASVQTGANGNAPLTTTAKTVNTGTYYVSESGGLTDYDSTLSCSINGGTAFIPANNAVTVAENQAAVCTFTNTRHKGSIELKKAWVGTGGQTTLKIGTSAGGSQTDSQLTGAAGAAPLTTGANNVDTGTYYVSESGGLTDYDSALACTKNGNAYTPGANDSVTVGKSDTVVCTFTNTRHTGTIKLVKNLVGGGNDKFNLKIDGVNQTVSPGGGTSFGNGDATAVLTKEIGAYAVSEAAVSPADLALYDRTLACVNNGGNTVDDDGSITVAKGDNWVCTFTNTKKGKVTVKKVTVPSAAGDVFGFTGTLAGAFNLNGAGAGSEKSVYVTAGTYTAIENDPSSQGYVLDSIVCNDTASTTNVQTRTATIKPASGGDVTCTFTNRKIDGKINVVKSPATQNVYLSGANSTAQYNYKVTNPGTTKVTNVAVSDDKCASVVLSSKNGDSSPSSLDPGDVWDYTCSVSAATLFSGGDAPVTNTVTAAGKDELGGAVSDTDTAVTKLLKPSIGVVKSPATQSVYSDGTASYSYAVTNTGNTVLTNVTVSDDKCSPLSAPDKTGDTVGSDATFDPGDTWTYTCSVSAGTLFSGGNDPVTNTVTAEGTEPALGRKVDDTDTAVTKLLRPDIKVVKSPASQTVNYNDDATYTYAVTNPGNTPLTTVSVTDDKCSPVTLDTKNGDATPATLDPGDTWTYKCTVSAATLFGASPSPDASITNTATAKGTDTEKGREVTDTDTAETKLQTGTLILEKDLTPSSDPGRFLLKHDGTAAMVSGTESNEFGDGDASDAIKVVAGIPVTVTEEAASQSNPLSDYARSATCIDVNEDTSTPTNILGHDDKVTVGSGQTVRCVFVNERKAKITVKKVVSNPEAGQGPEFGFQSDVPDEGWGSFSLRNGDSESTQVDAGKAPFTISEDDPSGIDAGYKLTGIACTDANARPDERVRSLQADVDLSKRNVTITPPAGADVTCVFTNKRIVGLDVVVKNPKSQAVYIDGTATYTYDVTNTGTSDLTDITVSDDKCPSVTGPNTGSDATPTVLNPGDKWTYTCSISASTLFGSGTAPITNTVTVNAKDELGRDVPPAKDTAVTNLLVPGIALDKTLAPGQTIAAGSPITFNIAVTNTGNTSFTTVAVGDDLCPANLSAADKSGDASPNTLDPGETWRYTCVVQTTAAQQGTTVVNTATVEGTDTGGKKLTATDNESVQIPAVQQGAGNVVKKRGSSRLRASSACVKAAYAQAAVTGSNIRSVTFYLNGKKVKTLTKHNAGNTFKVKFRTKRLRYGKYRVRAVVRYVSGASPASKTLSAQFNRCRPRVVVQPKFTG